MAAPEEFLEGSVPSLSSMAEADSGGGHHKHKHKHKHKHGHHGHHKHRKTVVEQASLLLWTP